MLFQQHGAKLRGVAVAVGDAVLGAQPRPARNVPTIGTVLSNLGQFFGWCLRHWKLIGIVLFAVFVLFTMRSCGDYFGLGKSKGELRLERELAEANARVLEIENERDAEIAQVARDVAVIRAQIRIASQRGQDEIAAAAPANEAPIDDGLAAAFHDALDGLCIQRADGSLANSCGSGA